MKANRRPHPRPYGKSEGAEHGAARAFWQATIFLSSHSCELIKRIPNSLSSSTALSLSFLKVFNYFPLQKTHVLKNYRKLVSPIKQQEKKKKHKKHFWNCQEFDTKMHFIFILRFLWKASIYFLHFSVDVDVPRINREKYLANSENILKKLGQIFCTTNTVSQKIFWGAYGFLDHFLQFK